MKLIAELVDVIEVTPQQRNEMFALMDSHYENVHRHLFEADLRQKRWVILIHDSATERLRGFSTQTLLDAKVGGRLVKALFSGDTIIHRECWGDRALAHVWGRFALSLIDAHPGEELYWFLISRRLQDLSLPADLLPRVLPAVRQADAEASKSNY